MADPLFLGVEIGGTKLQLGLGRGGGSILDRERRTIRPEAGAGGILDQVAEAYAVLVGRLGPEGPPPVAAGIGFGGPVDPEAGVAIRSHQVAGWDHFPIADWARRSFAIPVVAVGNDAETAGLGEAHRGAGRGLSPLFYVTIGSGIGGGLIVDGRIYRGAGVAAAEIGHLWVDGTPTGPRRLEEIASGWAIGARARATFDQTDNPSPAETAVTVAEAAGRGDPRALALLKEATDALGGALAHVATLLSPRRIILGGGVSLMPNSLWLDPIRSRVAERIFPPLRDSYDLVSAELGEEVVVHGALMLAHRAWRKSVFGDAGSEI